jgi:hypothetical protein
MNWCVSENIKVAINNISHLKSEGREERLGQLTCYLLSKSLDSVRIPFIPSLQL